jgi:two-component system, sensor histidine kinase and response regulator
VSIDRIEQLKLHGEVAELIDKKARAIYDKLIFQNYSQCDQMFAVLLFIEWLGGVLTALLVSPTAWEGVSSNTHIHVILSIWLGMAIIVLPIALAWFYSGTAMTRQTIAVGQILMGALIIHLTGGRLETHFLIFGSLTFLAFYADWKVLVTATVLTAVDHILRGLYLPFSVYGVTYSEPWRWAEHASWVLFADIFLIRKCVLDMREKRRIAEKQAQMELTNEIIEAQVVERTDQVKQSEEKFRNLCISVPTVIFESNSDGGWEVIGLPWFQLTASPIEKAKEWWTLVIESERQKTLESWKLSVREGREWSHEFRIQTLSGVTKWVKAKAVPLTGKSEADRRLIGTLEDVTDRKNAEENNRRLLLMNQRDDFMAMLANDLKNPIVGANRILGLMTEGRLGKLEVEQEEILGKIVDGNNELLRMIQHIISVYKYDRDSETQIFEQASISRLIKECVDKFQIQANEKRIKIELDLSDSGDVTIVGNCESIRVVIQNLLDNALKYMPDGGTIVLKAFRQGDRVMFKVNNSGSFIELDQRSRLFERPMTGEDNGNGYLPKVGLGLYMCRQIVDAHQGNISCESDRQGTTFTVSLPRDLSTKNSP